MSIEEREAALDERLARITELAERVKRYAEKRCVVGVWLAFDAMEREIIASGKPSKSSKPEAAQ